MEIKKVVIASILGAVSIVIDTLFKGILGNDLGTAYYAIPIIIIAVFYGPKYSIFIAFVADALPVFLTGATYMPLFSLGSVMWGVIPVVLKPNSKIGFKFLILLLTHIITTGLNTLALYVFYGSWATVLVSLPLRLAMLIPNTIIITLIVEALIEPVKYRLEHKKD